MIQTAEKIKTLVERDANIETLWCTLRDDITNSVKNNIPTKYYKPNSSPPWFSKHLKRMK